jgi:hypothetical protein
MRKQVRNLAIAMVLTLGVLCLLGIRIFEWTVLALFAAAMAAGVVTIGAETWLPRFGCQRFWNGVQFI